MYNALKLQASAFRLQISRTTLSLQGVEKQFTSTLIEEIIISGKPDKR